MGKLAQDVSKWMVWYVKTEEGQTLESYHIAETKERAVQAHLVHWGLAGLRGEPKAAISIQSFKGVICGEEGCLISANVPEYASNTLLGR